MKSIKSTHYKARRGFVIHAILVFVLALPFVLFFLDIDTFSKKPFLLMPIAVPVGLMFWVYFDTSYKILQGRFYYRCAFLKGNFSISDIREIKKEKKMLSSKKSAALTNNGLLIKYKAHEEIYVAPVSNMQLIDDLKQINRTIKVDRMA